MKDPRRRFTATQARNRFIACNGMCERCNQPLEESWHMHHRKPHSEGGQTIYENSMALCPQCHKEIHNETS